MKPSSQTALFGLGSILCVLIALSLPWIFMESDLVGTDIVMMNFFQLILGLLFIPIMSWYSYRAYLEKRQKVAHYGLFSPCRIIPSHHTQETPRYHYGLLLLFPLCYLFFSYVMYQNIDSSMTLIDIMIFILWGAAAVCIILGVIVYKESPTPSLSMTFSKYCPNCGRSGFKDLQFCSNCGTKLVQESPQQFNTSLIRDK